jgi:hypothetical protein
MCLAQDSGKRQIDSRLGKSLVLENLRQISYGRCAAHDAGNDTDIPQGPP